MNNREQDRMDADDNLAYLEEETYTETYRKQKARRRRGWHSFAAVIAGAVIGAMVCAGVFAVTAIHNTSTAAESELDYHDKVDMILDYLRVYHLDELDDEELGDILAKGLMDNIGDQYAGYYSKEEFDQMLEESAGEYAGIGVQIVMNDDGNVEVYKVFKESPAEESGIQLRDLIVEAEGVREFEDLDALISLVRGAEGTTVDLVIERNGEEIPLTVGRRNIVTDSVYGEMLDDEVGYIQIAEFNMATIQQFSDTLDDLLGQGMQRVIMDLRANPGGDYDSVVDVCDRVLPEGVIVTVEDRRGGMITENSDPTCLDIPIVLLVDENTASAAELFTMALMDYDMAEVVGTTTYGKGLVQSLFRMPDGSGLKFTTEKYYGPAGNWIQDTGIEPDYIVELPEEVYEDGIIFLEEDMQLKKAVELAGLDWDAFVEEQNAEAEALAEEGTEETGEAGGISDEIAEETSDEMPDETSEAED